MLFCPPVLLTTLTNPRIRSPLSAVPLHRPGGRSLPQRARGAPAAAISCFARALIPAGGTELSGEYFKEAENETQRRPDFPLFLIRIFLFDFFSIGILHRAEVIIFAILLICLRRLGADPIASAAIALILVELNLVLFSVAIKKSLVGSEWGADHSATFWSWRHFAYFFDRFVFQKVKA